MAVEEDAKKSEHLPAELSKVLQELPEEKREAIEAAFFSLERYSGPLPPPDYCEAIEKIVPGATHRIISVFEKQVNHRIEMEEKIVDNKFSQSGRGQIIGAILVALLCVISLILGLYGHDGLAAGIGVTTVISIAIVFVLNKLPFKGKEKE